MTENNNWFWILFHNLRKFEKYTRFLSFFFGVCSFLLSVWCTSVHIPRRIADPFPVWLPLVPYWRKKLTTLVLAAKFRLLCSSFLLASLTYNNLISLFILINKTNFLFHWKLTCDGNILFMKALIYLLRIKHITPIRNTITSSRKIMAPNVPITVAEVPFESFGMPEY